MFYLENFLYLLFFFNILYVFFSLYFLYRRIECLLRSHIHIRPCILVSSFVWLSLCFEPITSTLLSHYVKQNREISFLFRKSINLKQNRKLQYEKDKFPNLLAFSWVSLHYTTFVTHNYSSNWNWREYAYSNDEWPFVFSFVFVLVTWNSIIRTIYWWNTFFL